MGLEYWSRYNLNILNIFINFHDEFILFLEDEDGDDGIGTLINQLNMNEETINYNIYKVVVVLILEGNDYKGVWLSL